VLKILIEKIAEALVNTLDGKALKTLTALSLLLYFGISLTFIKSYLTGGALLLCTEL
jgi:hypothetical protein